MKKTAIIFFADGFEEVEALTVYDGLVRAGVSVRKISVSSSLSVTSSHNVTIQCDECVQTMDKSPADLVFLPGGMPGSSNLAQCWAVNECIVRHVQDRLVSAICAAPAVVLGPLGLLDGKKATCYPGCEDGLTGAETLTDRVVVDGKITTSRGVGTAISFGLSLIAQLYDQKKSDEIREEIVYGHGVSEA